MICIGLDMRVSLNWLKAVIEHKGLIRKLLAIDLDVFLGAAVGNRKHHANADQAHQADQRPNGADSFKYTGLPERRERADNQQQKPNKVHACPFHD